MSYASERLLESFFYQLFDSWEGQPNFTEGYVDLLDGYAVLDQNRWNDPRISISINTNGVLSFTIRELPNSPVYELGQYGVVLQSMNNDSNKRSRTNSSATRR